MEKPHVTVKGFDRPYIEFTRNATTGEGVVPPELIRCRMCGLWGDTRKGDLKPGSMNVETFTSIMDHIAREAPVAEVSLTPRGELFCNPHALDICRCVQQAGRSLDFVTNATLLDDDTIRELFTMNLHSIRVSVDGLLPETYAEIRGRDRLETVVQNIHKLCVANVSRPTGDQVSIILNFVLQDRNAHELVPFVRFWGPRVSRISILKWNTDTDSPLNAKRINRKFLKPPRYPCVFPWIHTFIDVEGDVYPCCADGFVSMKMGNVLEQPLKKIWLNDKYMKLRQAHLSGDFSEFPVCTACDYWNLAQRSGSFTLDNRTYALVEYNSSLDLNATKDIYVTSLSFESYLTDVKRLMQCANTDPETLLGG